MGHRDYKDAGFDAPRIQHNVMAFVGNGFDVQIMHDYDSRIDTRYTSFYHFLKLRSFNPTNPILVEMENLRKNGKENWSDVESAVGDLHVARRLSPVELANALREMQGQFSEFLDLAVPATLLSRLGADSTSRRLSIKSLAEFLADLEPDDYRSLRFAEGVNNFDVFNFLFVNFNYTPLLDDYLYLDQEQFDPLPHKTGDRNFYFQGNPRGHAGAFVRPGDQFSSYLMTDVVHPHGHQSIPRSLLFGIDEPAKRGGNRDESLRLAKPFWAQNDRRYEHLFSDTELFIIFGCSLGESDRWWWRHVADSLGQERVRPNSGEVYRPELVLYWYNGGSRKLTRAEVRDRFFVASGSPAGDRRDDYVHVVLHDESTKRVWLDTSHTP